MKKVISLFLALMMAFALAGTASAEGTPTFVVSEATAAPGETVRVTISIQNNTAISSVQLVPQYDHDVLEWTAVEQGDYVGTWNPRIDRGFVNWFGESGHNVSYDGVFATLVFTVKSDAAAGDYEVTVTYDPDDVFDQDEENVHFDVRAGKVTVTGEEPTTPTFVISEATAAPGETVRVTISIQNNTAISSVQLVPQYDHDVLEWTAVEQGDYVGTWNPRIDRGFVNWFGESGHNVSYDGVFATLVFTVKSDAAAGDYEVTVTYDPDDVFDQDEENVHFDIQAGKVTVLGPAYYLIGSMTDWQVNEAYKFVENPNATGEYMLETTLAVGDEFKAVSATGTTTNTWYPDGMDNNYVVDAAHSGNVTVYFRPDYTGGSDWHYNCLYIVARPTFKTQSLVLSGQIGLKFYVDLSMLSESERSASYMTFAIKDSVASNNLLRSITDRADFDENAKNSKGYYAFTCLVSPIQMADVITATLHYGDDKIVERTYSIKQYLVTYDSNKDLFNAKLQTLTEALADYGHYTQLFLAEANHFTIGEKYADMDKFYTESYDIETVKNEVESYAIVKQNDAAADITDITYSVSLEESPEINVYFKPVDGYTGTFTAKLGSSSVDATKQSDGRYLVTIPNISAHLLGKTYKVVVTTDSGTATVKVSVLSYVQGILNSEAYASNTKAQNAAASIYYYYKAAYAYKYGN